MRVCLLLTLLFLCAVAIADAPDTKDIAKLIDQLGDDELDVRNAAIKKLTAVGQPALEPLRKAAKSHLDADVRLRAIVLQRAIEKSLYGEMRQFIGHKGHIRSIAVTKDGKKAITGSMDGTARVWEIATGKELVRFNGHETSPAKKGKWVWSVSLSPDEKQVISSGALDQTLRLWTLDAGKEVRKYEGHGSWVYGAAYHPQGKYVLSSGAGDGAKDYTLRLFDVESAKEVRKLEGHTGYVWRAIFSPDGRKIASVGCNDNSYRIWDVESGKPLVIGADAHEGARVLGVAFSPDGRRLLTGAKDNNCRLWDVETGKLLRTYKGASDVIEAVAFSPDGKRFLAAENKLVHVFDTETGKIVHRFDEHPKIVFAVAWLPDGKHVLSGGEDMVMRMWKVP